METLVAFMMGMMSLYFIPSDQIFTWNIDEIQRNIWESQKEIIIEDYFLFMDRISNFRYARGCMWSATPKTRSEEKQKYVWCCVDCFDCSWLMKAYGFMKWVFTKKELWHLRSDSLYELWTKIDPRWAERWDFTYWKWFWEASSWSRSTHFAVVSSWYSNWSIWVYDNVNWKNKNELWERELKLYCNSKYCTYLWKYKIYISTNWLFELSQKKGIIVEKFVLSWL